MSVSVISGSLHYGPDFEMPCTAYNGHVPSIGSDTVHMGRRSRIHQRTVRNAAERDTHYTALWGLGISSTRSVVCSAATRRRLGMAGSIPLERSTNSQRSRGRRPCTDMDTSIRQSLCVSDLKHLNRVTEHPKDDAKHSGHHMCVPS